MDTRVRGLSMSFLKKNCFGKSPVRVRVHDLEVFHVRVCDSKFGDVRVRVHVRGFTICDVRVHVRVRRHRWTSLSADTSVRVHRSQVDMLLQIAYK